jgi:hypothetical protein
MLGIFQQVADLPAVSDAANLQWDSLCLHMYALGGTTVHKQARHRILESEHQQSTIYSTDHACINVTLQVLQAFCTQKHSLYKRQWPYTL